MPVGSHKQHSPLTRPAVSHAAADSDDTPFGGNRFVEAGNAEDASNQISTVVEPRQLLPVENDGSARTAGTTIALQNTQLFGMTIADSVDVISQPLVSYNIIVPLAGELYSRDNSQFNRVPLGTAHVISPQEIVNVR